MKLNKEKLNKQLEIMNEEQLLDLCKSTTSIINDLQDRINKAIEYIGLNEEDLKLYDIYDVNGIELLKILRGEDNGR